MKRSEINEVIKKAEAMIASYGFSLPKFAYWGPEEFLSKKKSAWNLILAHCGWDITDYGANDFKKIGLTLFTLRNGLPDAKYRKFSIPYAEKLLISRQEQVSPMHTHYVKIEDLINRGGADLIVELYGSDSNGHFDSHLGGTIFRDGIKCNHKAGERIKLTPGESVTLRPGNWHAFWAEGGDVLIGEVSTVNDDENDNFFRDEIGRFAEIMEDQKPLRLLVSDYKKWLF